MAMFHSFLYVYQRVDGFLLIQHLHFTCGPIVGNTRRKIPPKLEAGPKKGAGPKMWMLNMLPRWRRLRKGQTRDAIQTVSAGCGGTGMVVSCRNC